jgi:hypothetical protein
MSDQIHTMTALKPRNTLWRRLGGPQSRSERGGEDKNPCPYQKLGNSEHKYNTEDQKKRLHEKLVSTRVYLKVSGLSR